MLYCHGRDWGDGLRSRIGAARLAELGGARIERHAAPQSDVRADEACLAVVGQHAAGACSHADLPPEWRATSVSDSGGVQEEAGAGVPILVLRDNTTARGVGTVICGRRKRPASGSSKSCELVGDPSHVRDCPACLPYGDGGRSPHAAMIDRVAPAAVKLGGPMGRGVEGYAGEQWGLAAPCLVLRQINDGKEIPRSDRARIAATIGWR